MPSRMERMIVQVYRDDDGDVMVEALGGEWEGCAAHGSTLLEALTKFGEAVELYTGSDA